MEQDIQVRRASGPDFDYFDPEASLPIESIAQRLSHIPRHAGATNYLLSVAQHSCLVLDIVRAWGGNHAQQLYALLHDGHEAVISDIPTPFQDWLTGFTPDGVDVLELAKRELDFKILRPLGVPVPPTLAVAEMVKAADKVALIVEARSNFFDVAPFYAYDHPLSDLYDKHLRTYGRCGIDDIELPRQSAAESRSLFLQAYYEVREGL